MFVLNNGLFLDIVNISLLKTYQSDIVTAVKKDNSYFTDIFYILLVKICSAELQLMCVVCLQCLSDNRLGTAGARSLCRMLGVNAGLRKIDLSGKYTQISYFYYILNCLCNTPTSFCPEKGTKMII